MSSYFINLKLPDQCFSVTILVPSYITNTRSLKPGNLPKTLSMKSYCVANKSSPKNEFEVENAGRFLVNLLPSTLNTFSLLSLLKEYGRLPFTFKSFNVEGTRLKSRRWLPLDYPCPASMATGFRSVMISWIGTGDGALC